MKKILLFMITVLLTVGLAGCSGENSGKQSKVSLGMLRLTSSAPLFIALEKGYFSQEGLEVEPQWFDAAQPIAVATASSKIDVGATGITASLFNMAGSGQKLSIVADKGREEKGFSSSALVVATKDYLTDVQSIAGLKGKRIGITQKGSTFHYMLGRILESQGMSLKDVEIIPLNKVSAVMAALESGQIDAAILNEPNIIKTERAGYGKVLIQVGDIIPYQTSAIFYSPGFTKNEQSAVSFMKAYSKACSYYYDAVIDKKDPEKYKEVIGIIAKYVNAPTEDIEKGLPYIDRQGKLLKEDIKTQIDWYKKHDMLSTEPAPEQIVNSTFLEKAVR